MTEAPSEPTSGPAMLGHFDICGPLPGPGVTVLEASAGTGKTFTIAALVTRFVAEGVPLSEVLAVTFTRMATGELRDRVRARLVSAEAGLARTLRGALEAPSEDATEPLCADSLLQLLSRGSPGEVAERRERLAAAITSFDEATITTTHGFCQLMLSGLGVEAGVPAGAAVLEDPDDIVEQTVDDVYVRWTSRLGVPPFDRNGALEIARWAVANPETPLVPEPEGTPACLRRSFAEVVRREVERRLCDLDLLTFDDLLVRLKDTLHDPDRGVAACARLRSRFSVVLVDEFQDTDPIQWDVVRTAFGTGETVLVLIGDPKQAIYAFRGADVHSYLEAARLAERRFTLGENWRSDAGLLAALDALLDPVRLGHPEIQFRPVSAAPSHERPGLLGAPAAEPLRARLVPTRESGLETTRSGQIRKQSAVELVAQDLAADVVGVLGSGARLVSYADDGAERVERRVTPGDVAVLVATNAQARLVQKALRLAGVPAVVTGTESVLSTPAARDWLALLEATEQPASRARAVAVALTPFLGMTGDDVAAADELEWEALHARLHRWNALLRRRGVASLFRTVLADEGVPGRLLQERDGERKMTDLGHIAQLLHVEASAAQHGPTALRAWLARRIEEAAAGREGASAEDRSRWIDSDADAVQVLTIHRSKGLEFPVVYCPFLWDAAPGKKGRPVVFHDPADGMRRKLDVAGIDGGSDYDLHFQLQRQEERGEALRSLYVALTRAKHQVVLWWIQATDSHQSPLGRLLLARDGDGEVAASSPRAPRDDEVRALFERLAATAPGLVGIEQVATRSVPRAGWSSRVAHVAAPLGTAPFGRSFELGWTRTSYSGITALVHGGPDAEGAEGAENDHEDLGTIDEPLAGAPAGTGAGAAGGVWDGWDGPDGAGEPSMRDVRSLWSDLPSGTGIGTFVHRVLERIDFTAPDLEGEIARRISGSGTPPLEASAPLEPLVAALRASITTPLGPLPGGISLAQIGRADRIDEMGFELPLAGGDRPGAARGVSTRDMARLFELHEAAGSKNALAGYAQRLRDPLLETGLRGYLTGSLDLVFRTPTQHRGDGGTWRYFVADYKTNRLGPDDEVLSAWHYRPAALRAEMLRMHYPLQAILYLVALHRYLRWRLRDYDPEVHLGGVLYLFLRGMSGPGTPAVDGTPCGVFSWRPPAALVTGMSELFEAES
ncbi:MAG: UvrD-helicase domain-containing protein [Actinomycetota bacterium]|nr:UvrD-helicase domain-containing protein [Actinomycetota bacterium]